MNRSTTALLSCLLTFWLASPAAAARPVDERTLFTRVTDAWAFGTVRLQKPFEYRDGKLLAFAGTVGQVLHSSAPNARNLVLVWDVAKEGRALEHGDSFLAPVELLPPYAYWRDNLPPTRRHGVSGGVRYVFVGDEEVEVRRALAPYISSLTAKAPGRWSQEVVGISSALASTNDVVRADAARHMGDYGRLTHYFSDEAAAHWRTFLKSDAPAEQKAFLAGAAGRYEFSSLTGALEALASADEAEATVAALGSLNALGVERTREQLDELAQSKSEVVRAWAWGQIAAGSGGNVENFAAVSERLASDPSVVTQDAILGGFGAGKVTEAGGVLAEALGADDPIGPTAAAALAALDASDSLGNALKKGQLPEALNAVTGLALIPDCQPCAALLAEQAQSHAVAEVRERIAEVLDSKATRTP
ncbi:MAG: hypothetical protein ACI8TX_002026 [Hyphomicrobiaceae bacterium]|jgi:hypothetical protein